MKSLARLLLKLLCRIYPIERGKFKILNEIYFKYLAPQQDTWVAAKLSYNITMRLNIAEFLQAHIFLFGSYELPTIKFIRSYLTTGDVCFDIGAQIGYLSLAMAVSGNKNVFVYSFEPEPKNLERFSENIRLNSLTNVNLISKAVSNNVDQLKLYMSRDHNAGTHSIIKDDPNVTEEFVVVDATTIDNIIHEQEIDRLDLVKIDVEGAELEVVEGATVTLKIFKPTLIIELSESIQQTRNYSTVTFKSKMSEFGYLPFTLTDAGKLRPVANSFVHQMDNVVFVHSDNMDRVSSLINHE
ncbi:MAG: FkbM family methyltransferase [Ignavibacteria bacterium]|jgi:FkbM family methyltransferase|nr:FkbM family methyltransferase [Ignavibacteria bacterium]